MKIISFLLHPQFLFPLVLLLPFLRGNEVVQYCAVLLIAFILPFSFFLYLYLTGKISDWDVTQRKQRYALYGASLLGLLLALVYINAYASNFVFQEFLKLFLLALVLVGLNFKIKVSIHCALVTTFCILLLEYFTVSPLVFLLIPLVAVSRVYLKKHSRSEVILGVSIPMLLFYVVFTGIKVL